MSSTSSSSSDAGTSDSTTSLFSGLSSLWSGLAGLYQGSQASSAAQKVMQMADPFGSQRGAYQSELASMVQANPTNTNPFLQALTVQDSSNSYMTALFNNLNAQPGGQTGQAASANQLSSAAPSIQGGAMPTMGGSGAMPTMGSSSPIPSGLNNTGLGNADNSSLTSLYNALGASKTGGTGGTGTFNLFNLYTGGGKS